MTNTYLVKEKDYLPMHSVGVDNGGCLRLDSELVLSLILQTHVMLLSVHHLLLLSHWEDWEVAEVDIPAFFAFFRGIPHGSLAVVFETQ